MVPSEITQQGKAQAAARGSMNSTARYATLVVLAHAAVVFWHLVLVAKITPGLTDFQILAATTAINVLPAAALLLLWTHFPRLGGLFLFLPLVVGLVIGGMEHFVTPGPLNVFDMSPTPWVSPFQATAVLLLMLEVLGCWIAIQAVRGGGFSKAEATQ
jgi:hypothetical protein